jgi:hypothetical protein
MGSSEPGFSTLLHPVVDGIEPHQPDNNEIDRDDKVQKSRHDQNEDAGDKGDTGCPAALISVFFEKLPPCLVGIEACASAHHWSRELKAVGHTVRLMPPVYVKPYVKRHKNHCLFPVSSAVNYVAPSYVSMVCSLLVTSGLVMFGRFPVVASGVRQMF